MKTKERKSPRHKDHDYSTPAYYFVTICVKNHHHLFGQVSNGKMELKDFGEIVKRHWIEIPSHFMNVEIDYFVVMPNHVHGIIIINSRDTACRVLRVYDYSVNQFPAIYQQLIDLSNLLLHGKLTLPVILLEINYGNDHFLIVL